MHEYLTSIHVPGRNLSHFMRHGGCFFRSEINFRHPLRKPCHMMSLMVSIAIRKRASDAHHKAHDRRVSLLSSKAGMKLGSRRERRRTAQLPLMPCKPCFQGISPTQRRGTPVLWEGVSTPSAYPAWLDARPSYGIQPGRPSRSLRSRDPPFWGLHKV